MSYYRVCPYCGSHLDPGEACDCRERPAAKSQALANLQRNGLPGATNTEQAEGGTDLTRPDSTSTITENGGFVK